MKKFIKPVITLITMMIFMSCAAIINGTSQDVFVSSNPAKAKVIIKTTSGLDVFSGETPSSIKLKRDSEYYVTVKVDGYKESKILVTQNFSPIFLGNILCGGIIGMVVDLATGAMYNLEPQSISVNLETACIEGEEDQTYAVFHAKDAEGQVRKLMVPMIKM